MFCDRAEIIVKGGRGGDGIVSFRHAKYEPKGGPDGGDGGRGGRIFFLASSHQADLIDFANKEEIKAEDGKPGEKNERRGASGEDLILRVPVGTVIFQKRSLLPSKRLFDFKKKGQKELIVKGGKEGRGNAFFKSSTNQTPRKATKGRRGQQKNLFLRLKLLTDIGIIGKPNAGKSTLLSVITRAKPKIAEYPFTTISPNLGILEYKGKRLVVADIPGLIKDAHKGKGLGDKFLQHIERCKKLVHIIDISEPDPIKSYKTIRRELKNYSNKLCQKEEYLALNKIDLIGEKEIEDEKKKLEKMTKKKVFLISAATKKGIDVLLDAIIGKG